MYIPQDPNVVFDRTDVVELCRLQKRLFEWGGGQVTTVKVDQLNRYEVMSGI